MLRKNTLLHAAQAAMILPARRTFESVELSGKVLLAAAIAIPDEPVVAGRGGCQVDLDDAHPHHCAVAVGVAAGVGAGVADCYVAGVAPAVPDVVCDRCR